MIYLYIHGSVYCRSDLLSVFATVFMRALYVRPLPIGPIDEVLEHSDGKDVRKILPNDVVFVLSVQICKCYIVQSAMIVNIHSSCY